jgi:cobalt-zinc-cadmium efflux system membrane fusion protein
MNTRVNFLLCYFLLVSVCSAESDLIKISEAQIFNLGIKLGKLEPVNKIPLLYAPAKVTVPPTQEYLISASQAGLISKLNIAIGDQVKQGQVLAYIKSPELLTLQRQFLKANSNRRLAKAGFERDKKLLDEGVISDRRWQETRARYLGFVSEVNEARQLLEIAGLSKSDLKQLGKTHKLTSQLNVRAPISGVILDRLVVAGERIDMLAPIFRIANLETLWLDIHVPQEQVGNIRIGDKVQINNSSITAQISLLGQSVNPENQTVLARAVIDSEKPNVRVGQTVTTQIIQTSSRSGYKVPNSGIAQHEGEYHIFIRNAEGFLVKDITILGKESSYSIIGGDLTGQEEIAIRGGVALKANWLGLGSDENSGGHSHGGH